MKVSNAEFIGFIRNHKGAFGNVQSTTDYSGKGRSEEIYKINKPICADNTCPTTIVSYTNHREFLGWLANAYRDCNR